MTLAVNQSHPIHAVRLMQLIGITALALVIVGLKSWYEDNYFDLTAIALSVALIGCSAWLQRKSYLELSAALFLLTLTALVLAFMWRNSGLKDNSIVALPGILVFAAMIGAYRLFPLVAITVIVNVLLMGWMTEQGAVNFLIPNTGLSGSLNIAIILIVVSSAVLILSLDYQQLLGNLRENMTRVELSKAAVEHRANHDILTGLPNRKMAEEYYDRLSQILQENPRHKAAMFYLDLDEFKDINDVYGHSLGDRFLIEVTHRIKAVLDKHDIFCRIGGDEFLIMLGDVQSANEIESLAALLLETVAQPVELTDTKLSCNSSIGIVLLPDDAANYEQAVKRADIAMYQAKEAGKNCFFYYQPEFEKALMQRLALQKQIKTSLEAGDFFALFQPIVRLNDKALTGAEALVRWRHPTLGGVSPVQFIPLAEKTGYIDLLFLQVLSESCEFLQRMNAQWPEFYVSVNVSPVQMLATDFFPAAKKIIEQYDVNPCNIKFEVTESHLIDQDPKLLRNMEQVQSYGIGVFLDDFGTGYSNLGYLKKLKFEAIKIDRSFIHQIHSSSDHLTIVKAIHSLAQELGLNIVAEGVETEKEQETLRVLGIKSAQGYLWSKPDTADNIERLMMRSTHII